MHQTVILGCGGHAKVVVEILRDSEQYEPVGYVGPTPPTRTEPNSLPYLGDDTVLPEVGQSGIRYAFVALGDNWLRDRLIQRVTRLGFQLANAVSRSASIASSARLGQGSAVMPGAVIGPDTTLEVGCIVNTNAALDHDGRLGRCSHIGPGATLAGGVGVGDMAFVATGSSVIPDVVIGDNAIVGAGSVVVRDIPPDVVAYGVPATVQRYYDMATRCRDGEDQDEPPTFRLVS